MPASTAEHGQQRSRVRPPERIAPVYDRLPDFRRLADRLDARGALRNAWLERHVLGRKSC